jgi:type I restriction enzyme S subunit
MKPYLAYKDSGIEWIGEVPEHWDIVKLKWLLKSKLKYGANESAELDDESCPRYIRITDFGDDGKLRQETFKSLPIDKAKEYLLCEGDVLFARSGATVGKTFLFTNYEGIACFAGYLIKATPKTNRLNSEFLYHFTKSNSYDSWKNSIFIQATIQNIGADKYSTLEIPIPPFPEQQSIANILHQKTTQIDTLIEKKQKQIELLKEERTAIINQAVTKGLNPDVPMKDSGIEWLGEVPEHWEIRKLKYLSNIFFSNVDKKVNDGEIIIRSCNYIDVYKNDLITEDINFLNISATKSEISKFLIKEGDVLVTKDSETPDDIAIPALVKYNSNDVVCGYHLAIIRPLGILGEYIFRLLQSEVNNHFFILAKGVTRFGLSTDSFNNLMITVPPMSEQFDIIHHINEKLSLSDSLVNKIQEQIIHLQEYRTSLISNVVTGKIDVRNENISIA